MSKLSQCNFGIELYTFPASATTSQDMNEIRNDGIFRAGGRACVDQEGGKEWMCVDNSRLYLSFLLGFLFALSQRRTLVLLRSSRAAVLAGRRIAVCMDCCLETPAYAPTRESP
jgi:hypothetical protein